MCIFYIWVVNRALQVHCNSKVLLDVKIKQSIDLYIYVLNQEILLYFLVVLFALISALNIGKCLQSS